MGRVTRMTLALRTGPVSVPSAQICPGRTSTGMRVEATPLMGIGSVVLEPRAFVVLISNHCGAMNLRRASASSTRVDVPSSTMAT
jgi:hypothetical protein